MALHRLIDLAGIADLELKALMKPAYQEPEARPEYPEIDACSTALFGITVDQAEAVERPADWDGIDQLPVAEQVKAFEAEGWDVTDNRRRPLRMLLQFNQQLWLALRGVAGSLPFQAETNKPEQWATNLASEAARFRRR